MNYGGVQSALTAEKMRRSSNHGDVSLLFRDYVESLRCAIGACFLGCEVLLPIVMSYVKANNMLLAYGNRNKANENEEIKKSCFSRTTDDD